MHIPKMEVAVNVASRAKRKKAYREQQKVKTNGDYIESLFKKGFKCIDISPAIYGKAK